MPVKSYELLGYYRPTLTRIGDAQLYWSGRYAPLAFIRSLSDCFRVGIGRMAIKGLYWGYIVKVKEIQLDYCELTFELRGWLEPAPLE